MISWSLYPLNSC